MKDLKLKMRDLHVSYTLGCVGDWNLYMSIGTMKDSKTKAEESTRLPFTGLCHSCCHAYLETSVSQR